jgi:hypothetical protein
MYGRTLRREDTSALNPTYSGFWKEQERQRELLKQQQYAQNSKDKEIENAIMMNRNQTIIDDMKRKVKEEEMRSGHSGNFWKDFKWGASTANDRYLKPLTKYINKGAPILSKLPGGTALITATNSTSGIVDKLM